MTLPEIHKQAQISLLNEDYDTALAYFKKAWDIGDRSQADNVVRCLLVSCHTPDYQSAKAFYRQLTVTEKRKAIVWFYMYFRDNYSSSKASKILLVADKLGSDFVNTIYSVRYYPSKPRLSLKYHRRNYVCTVFNCQHPWSIKLFALLTYLPPIRGAVKASWSQFVYNRENRDYAERKNNMLLSTMKEIMDDVKSFINRKK